MEITDMRGKVCLVTGSTSGIGKATATGLARMGARVVVVGRDPTRGAEAVREIKAASSNDDIDLLLTDLSSQAAVRQLAEDVVATYPQLHVLVNNAFVFLADRRLTVDGLETIFAVNYLAPFLLTNLLLDLLKASVPSRIVNVAAPQLGAKIHFDDLQGEQKFNPHRQNLQAKLALVMFTYTLAKRLEGTGVTVNSLNPGLVNTRSGGGGYPGFTGVAYRVLKPVMKNAEQGAETPIYLASSAEVDGVTGKFWHDKKEAKSTKESHDEEEQRRLWDVSEELTGVRAR